MKRKEKQIANKIGHCFLFSFLSIHGTVKILARDCLAIVQAAIFQLWVMELIEEGYGKNEGEWANKAYVKWKQE